MEVQALYANEERLANVNCHVHYYHSTFKLNLVKLDFCQILMDIFDMTDNALTQNSL